MRVRHLADIEIQALLDRRAIGRAADVSGDRYRKDLDSQEHLDNCPVCRAEMEAYRGLYAELSYSERPPLPRNFARKVTFSLPPFRARRTRARLQLASIWASSLLISLFWLIGQMPLGWFVAQALGTALVWREQVDTLWSLLAVVLPHSNVVVTWILVPLAGTAEAIQKAFTVEAGPADTIVLAGLALAMIAWVDSLYQSTLRQRN